jgi:hypothetical protein
MQKFEYVTEYSEKLQKRIRFQIRTRAGYGAGAYKIIARKLLAEHEAKLSEIDVLISKATDKVNELAATYNAVLLCERTVFDKSKDQTDSDEMLQQTLKAYHDAQNELHELKNKRFE